ncbi:uncharacterized protein LOC125756318 [Rhipicephalus sanguineus]|uniref:uncharacterized protein LOC125756318 n=1 Tax=Rhipicephalus sanguineus TaxID=34632 RepID=UPI0020C5569B|nr:uncharacterized protein LOC125756318 [Rhipicephalus sanguineus]
MGEIRGREGFQRPLLYAQPGPRDPSGCASKLERGLPPKAPKGRSVPEAVFLANSSAAPNEECQGTAPLVKSEQHVLWHSQGSSNRTDEAWGMRTWSPRMAAQRPPASSTSAAWEHKSLTTSRPPTKKVDVLQKTVNLILKVDDLENRSRRNNLIIYGVKEAVEEDQPCLEQIVSKEIFQDLLNIRDVPFQRIHRIGKPSANKCRPVIIKLLDGRDKGKILKNCRKLRNSEFSICEDFSPRVQQIRKKLWDSARTNRDKGDKVMLFFDKIKINGKQFRWDEDRNERVPFATQ